MNDEELIGRFFAREESAITHTEAKYGRLCTAVARKILHDERDVEECVSDVWVRLWNAIPPDKPLSLKAYIARIARNLALDKYTYNAAEKRASSLTEAFDELEAFLPAEDTAVEHLEQAEFSAFLNRFLEKQSAENRKIFVRRYFYGDSVHEIAAAFAVSEGKVKSCLFRTREKLRIAMQEETK